MNDDLNLYINFVLHAVLGRLADADQLMRLAGAPIRRAADALAAYMPIGPAPIYRGMLLDPDKPLVVDPRLTFISWSEDRDVARWFASPGSVISEPLAEHDPRLRGYLLTLAAPRSRVLFHYSWVRAFGDLAACALLHPLMGPEGHRQIAWSLRTQCEVITEPVEFPTPEPVGDVDVVALDLKLAPSWVLKVAS